MRPKHRNNYKKQYSNPKISIPLTAGDWVIEFFGIVLLLITFYQTTIHYSSLPIRIPTHFDLAGHANGFSSKLSLLFLPLITWVLYAGITILCRYPHVFNFPVSITEQNAVRQYTLATRLLRALKVSLSIVFGCIQFMIIQGALGKDTSTGVWFLPLFGLLVLGPLAVYLILASKASK